MKARFACSACGTPNPEFALRCASCDAPLPSASIGSSSTVPDRTRTLDSLEDSLVGREIGPYRVEGHLGSGAMGVVYRAVDSRLLRPVALKVLTERLALSDRARGRMLREARAAARLKSKHVVHVLDHGTWEGRPYIAMEYLEGRTLRARLDEEGRLGADETLRWISQIAQGLDRAHAAGIVHRDLKPENIFIAREEDGEVAKILDFGVAKAAEEWADVAATHAGALLGTPAYMSPEQANGVRALDHRSDLWSLGVIVFECLIGRRPFDRDQLGALCVQILSEPLPVPSTLADDLPAAFDGWWQRAAARAPADRFQSATELADALAEAMRQSGAAAIAPRTEGPARRSRRATVAIGAAVALAAVVVASVSSRPPSNVAAGGSQAVAASVSASALDVRAPQPAESAPPPAAETATLGSAESPPQKTPPDPSPVRSSAEPHPRVTAPSSAGGPPSAAPKSSAPTAAPSTARALASSVPVTATSAPASAVAPTLDPALFDRRD